MERTRFAPSGEEAHELRDHDQRTRRRLGHAEPVQHLAGRHPVIVIDRLLRHIGQHRIGTTEGDHGHLAEEHRDLGEDVVAAQAEIERRHRHQPEGQEHRRHGERPAQVRPGMRRSGLAQQRLGIGHVGRAHVAVAAARLERRPAELAAREADDAGADDDDGERHVVEEDGDEGRDRDRAHDVVAQGALADAQHRLDHDHQHGGLQPEEQALHQRHLAQQHVDPGKRHDGEQPRQDEQCAGHQAAPGLVHQPADVDGELLRLGAGQQGAVVQRLQETLLADPLLLLDDDAMHHGDLAGRSAEGECRDTGPHFHGFGEGDAVVGTAHRALRKDS